ncbi:hydrolase [Alkalihalobacillus trypoxylicola]|uniref:Hydrolase n=1 Tax=Alkalihalobacillus trypoxylicola TaxID=519424 RepID=A0A161PLQ6_9BACI|nr:hydrolase [Alkalihalobacillus trypoxylicola]
MGVIHVKATVDKSTVFLLNSDVYYEYYKHPNKENRPVIIMIHGFLSSSYCFRKMVSLLQKDFNCLLIDLPGFGRSGKNRDFHYSFENYAKLVLTLAKLLHINQAILLGHSMGGQVALYMASQSPQFVHSLILLNSSAYLKKVKKAYYYATYFPFAPQIMRWWMAKKNYRETIEQVVFNRKMISNQIVEEYSRPFLDKEFYHSLLYLMRDREGDLTKEQLKTIQHPALILWGENDQIIPLHIGRKLSVDLPHNQFYSFKKTGHLLPEERPKEIVKHIHRFFNDIISKESTLK